MLEGEKRTCGRGVREGGEEGREGERRHKSADSFTFGGWLTSCRCLSEPSCCYCCCFVVVGVFVREVLVLGGDVLLGAGLLVITASIFTNNQLFLNGVYDNMRWSIKKALTF